MLEALNFADLGGLSLDTATVVLLYKIHRDGRELAKEHKFTRHWLDRIKAHIWPEVFKGDNCKLPD